MENDTKKINIGILGVGWSNKGSETMARTLVQELRSRIGGEVYFNFFVSKTDLIKSSSFQNMKIFYDGTTKIKFVYDFIVICLYGVLPLKIFLRTSPLLKEINSCDVFIDISGYYFHDKNNLKSIIFKLSRILFVRVLRKKYYFFPQSFGPLNDKKKIFFIRYFLPLAEKIYVRGQESKDCLLKITGNTRNVELMPDIAFLFDGKFVSKKEKIFAISVNKKLNNFNDNYKKNIVEITKYITGKYQFNILLIPHQIIADDKKKKSEDDLDLCYGIYKMLDTSSQNKTSIITDRDCSAQEYKALVSRCSFMLASRFHMAVAALSLSIPTITLGWSFKYKELMNWFDMKGFAINGLSNNFFDDVFKHKIERLIKDEDDIRKILEEKNKYIKNKLDNFFKSFVKEIDIKI